ncbi:hypothetical protein N7468_008816 [Penicillium chermesinum]|uniref:Uncharacterized protein n=1 Tax=Penicillium chermesinum TaxID=63820 RepID=A0A9W9NGL7_9EURO|nr:uncharacterized protein N7468_008816 [Penicillium chermesinum]KAJ5219612.1 hypothetical protein N7468_008816 [Penicillium chermesinum]
MMDTMPTETSPPSLVFYDIAFRQPRAKFSAAPNPWKARYTLNVKNVPYTTQFVDLLRISDLRQELHIPASRKHADGSDYFTLPMLVDQSTSSKIGDSFDIAVYLDQKFPQSGVGELFPAQTLDFQYAYNMPGLPPLSDREGMDQGVYREYAQFNTSVDAVFSTHCGLMGSGMRFDDDREKAIRKVFEDRAGMSWDEMALRGKARTNMLAAFREALEPLARLLRKNQAGPFVLGERLSYADLIIGGWLRMCSATLPEGEWEDMKTWHDSVFGKLHDALQKYAMIERLLQSKQLNLAKRAKIETNDPNPPAEEQPQSTDDNGPPSTHPTYPFPIPNLPSHIAVGLTHSTPGCDPRVINNQPDLDLLYFQPYIPRVTANELFNFLRRELPFYRVQYTIKRGSTETQITTPRYTTVFGVDDTAKFVEHPSTARTASTKAAHPVLVHAQTNQPIPTTPAPKYQYPPRPIPACLAHLQHLVQAATGSTYNFCLVNYYASAEDSISFHSDDERFLGAEPCIASLSLGGEREFLMKHKAAGKTGTQTGDPGLLAGASVKMGLGSGDMVVMRGRTQAHWLHSIPKRRGRNAEAIRGADQYYVSAGGGAGGHE